MEGKSHFLAHFIPGMLAGVVVGFAIGSLFVLSLKVDTSAGTSVVETAIDSDSSAKCATLADVSVRAFGESKVTYAVFVDDELVFDKTFDEPQMVSDLTADDFFQVSDDSRNAYFDFEPDGLGGYILYSGRYNLYQLDLCKGEVAQLSKTDFVSSSLEGYELVLDISPDESRIVGKYVPPIKDGISSNPYLYVQDVGTGVQQFYSLPDDGYYALNAKFSPDGSMIAVAAAKSNPDDESGIVWTFDAESGTFFDHGEKTPDGCSTYWILNGWNEDGTVDTELASSCE